MLERRIDDYWNIDVSRDLSDSWTGFTQFTPLEEKPPEEYMWSTRKQLTSRPDHLWPELWRGMSNQTLCGLRFGKICLVYRNAKRSINVQLKNQSSIMQEDYEESISLTLRTWSSRKSSKTQGENRKIQWLQLCLARFARKASIGKPVARLMISSPSLHVSWKPVIPQECVRKNLSRNIMRTISQEKGTIH